MPGRLGPKRRSRHSTTRFGRYSGASDQIEPNRGFGIESVVRCNAAGGRCDLPVRRTSGRSAAAAGTAAASAISPAAMTSHPWLPTLVTPCTCMAARPAAIERWSRLAVHYDIPMKREFLRLSRAARTGHQGFSRNDTRRCARCWKIVNYCPAMPGRCGARMVFVTAMC